MATKKNAEATEKKSTGKKRGNPNITKKKGEEGYFERNTAAATEAAAKKCAIFPDANEFKFLLEQYFEDCDAREALYSPAGWCLYLSARNPAGRIITVETFNSWVDGDACPHLQEAAQMAYMRYREQIETDPRYQEKGMVTRSIFLQKQSRMGGYQDKVEAKNDQTFRFVFGNSMDESDFK